MALSAIIDVTTEMQAAQGILVPNSDSIDYATVRFDRVIRARRINQSVSIDGRLSEDVWEVAESANHFVQQNPHPGIRASNDTDVRFLYDDDNLYVGVRCWDADTDHLRFELEKDFSGVQNDMVGIFLDSLHDQQSGFYFGTNPGGARHDFQASGDDSQRNNDWDGVWDVQVTIDEAGWTAEFRIPFKTLRFSEEVQQEWGLNLIRRVRRINEDSFWVPLPRRYRIARSSMAGTLTGLEGIHRGRNVKIKPYAISKTLGLGSAALGHNTDGGLDVKFGVTKSMTLDLSYRTDFSQVEADQQQINLTRFSLFFPEKREFFLENSGIFGVAGAAGSVASGNVIPFFSRRIGLSSDGMPIPILGGARLTGRTGSYDIGVLAMKTGEEKAVPSNSFLVGRIRRTLRAQSTVGAFVASRDSTIGGDSNRLYGVDTFLRFFDKLEASSYLMRTDTPQRRGRDQARRLGIAWRDDDLTLSGEYEEVQPNFVVDTGFVRRPDTRHYSTDASWRPRPRRSTAVRNYLVGAAADYYFASGTGDIETRQQNVSTGLAFQSGAMVEVTATDTLERLVAPFAIRPGVIIPVGDYQARNISARYTSDLSRAINGSVNVGNGEFWDGRNTALAGTLTLRPSPHVNIGLNYSRNDIRLPHGSFVTTLVGTRVRYAFTSRAFLHSFLQYNATTNQFSSNTRFNILHRPLSDLFIVYNERRDTSSGSLLERALIVKFTNMFDF
jgi:hypothetical protein